MGKIYFADDISLGAITAPNSQAIERPFKATLATMLGTTGAAGVLIGDVICLAPIPGNCVLSGYEIRVPELDTGSAVTYDVGDNVVLSGAINGTVGTGFTTPALGTSFTLTAAASTSGFTATNGVLMINGHLFGYASLSGSTFVTVYADAPGIVIPAGSLIQQAGNFAAYQAAAAVQAGKGINMVPYGSLSDTSWASATALPGALPAAYIAPYTTVDYSRNPPVPSQIGQTYFCMKIHASPTTYNAPSVAITGSIRYAMKGQVW